MDTPTSLPEVPPLSGVKLLPLEEGQETEKVANLLARLIGDGPKAATSALLILMGLQDYLNTGHASSAAAVWEPIMTAREMKKTWGGQAYRKALEAAAAAHGKDEANFRLYSIVSQFLLGDPEQEKFQVDDKA